MQTIEIMEARGDRPDAGYLRLEYSPARGEYFVDLIQTKAEYRRQGIAAALMEAARAQLGYYPAPEVILNAAAVPFWTRYGWTEGFDTEKQRGFYPLD
jgi:GNAT superfamily N-acetyltransferase